jgi:hypothetical protein
VRDKLATILLSKISKFNIKSSNKLDSKKVENWTRSGGSTGQGDGLKGSMVDLVEGSGGTKRRGPLKQLLKTSVNILQSKVQGFILDQS